MVQTKYFWPLTWFLALCLVGIIVVFAREVDSKPKQVSAGVTTQEVSASVTFESFILEDDVPAGVSRVRIAGGWLVFVRLTAEVGPDQVSVTFVPETDSESWSLNTASR